MKRQITIHSISGVRGRPGIPRKSDVGKTATIGVARKQNCVSMRNNRSTIKSQRFN
jgi:hypothetical protein